MKTNCLNIYISIDINNIKIYMYNLNNILVYNKHILFNLNDNNFIYDELIKYICDNSKSFIDKYYIKNIIIGVSSLYYNLSLLDYSLLKKYIKKIFKKSNITILNKWIIYSILYINEYAIGDISEFYFIDSQINKVSIFNKSIINNNKFSNNIFTYKNYHFCLSYINYYHDLNLLNKAFNDQILVKYFQHDNIFYLNLYNIYESSDKENLVIEELKKSHINKIILNKEFNNSLIYILTDTNFINNDIIYMLNFNKRDDSYSFVLSEKMDKFYNLFNDIKYL